MTLKAVTLLCLMIKDRLTSSTISQDRLLRKAVPAGWAEAIEGGGQNSGACTETRVPGSQFRTAIATDKRPTHRSGVSMETEKASMLLLILVFCHIK